VCDFYIFHHGRKNYKKHEAQGIKAEAALFARQLDMRVVEYIDEELQPHFQSLVAFTRQLDQMGGVEAVDINVIEPSILERVAKDFSQTYRQALSDMNAATLQSFANFNRGTLVLHALLSKLFTQYQAFVQTWERRFPPNVRTSVQPVPMQLLVAEIKKYRSSF
jgi:hypothetical protein